MRFAHPVKEPAGRRTSSGIGADRSLGGERLVADRYPPDPVFRAAATRRPTSSAHWSRHQRPARVDGIAHDGDNSEQICRTVVESDLVVADVGGNPHAMYELGLRHITDKPAIPLGEVGQLPFGIASIRTIEEPRATRWP